MATSASSDARVLSMVGPATRGRAQPRMPSHSSSSFSLRRAVINAPANHGVQDVVQYPAIPVTRPCHPLPTILSRRVASRPLPPFLPRSRHAASGSERSGEYAGIRHWLPFVGLGYAAHTCTSSRRAATDSSPLLTVCISPSLILVINYMRMYKQ